MRRFLPIALACSVRLLIAAAPARAAEITLDPDRLRDERAAQPSIPRRGADSPAVFRAALTLHETDVIEIAAETTELLAAVRTGNIARVQAALKSGAQPNRAGRHGERALYEAVRAGRMEIARLLLEKGADPDLRGADGITPLAAAALAGNARLTRLLLKRGADPYLRSATGNIPLYDAIQLQRLDVIRVFIDAGIDLAQPGRNGTLPGTPHHDRPIRAVE